MSGSPAPLRPGLRLRPSLAVALCVTLGTLLPALYGYAARLPEPVVHDEFSYLLGADTLALGRLANPPPKLPEFFETHHVLVVPRYQSKYPPAQAVVLALGKRLTGQPIWGVWLSCGLFAGSLCWMLQAWAPRPWALATSLVTITTLGISTYWAQSYWGGAIAACGSALVLGGVRRTIRSPTVATTISMAVGAVLLATSRPYEGAFVLAPAGYLVFTWLFKARTHQVREKALHVVLPAAMILGGGAAFTGAYNRAITGSSLQLPYAIHHRQYFGQGIFLFSRVRAPERTPTPRIAEFRREWIQPPARGFDLVGRVIGNFIGRVALSVMVPFGFAPQPVGTPYRAVSMWLMLLVFCWRPLSTRTFALALLPLTVLEVCAWRFLPAYPFSLAPIVIPAWLMAFERTMLLESRWCVFVTAVLLIAGLGQAIVSWWYPHYAAPLVPLVLAGAALCLQRLARVAAQKVSPRLGVVMIVLLAVHVPPMALSAALHRSAAVRAEGELRSRGDVVNLLERRGGSHLVFVRYDEGYPTALEWVYNGADLEGSVVVFAHDLGEDRNPDLLAVYTARSAWRLTVSARKASLEPYASSRR